MRIYNTMQRQKVDFIPIEENKVKIYACGPTVYDYFHIGNARPFIVFDVLRRYLEYRGYDVTFVQNFTDIDDKIIERANEQGISHIDLSERYIGEYFKDAEALGIKRADIHPKATENISEIISLIKTLIDKGYAYVSEAGDVYFAAEKFEKYGKLSGQNINELLDGSRIDNREDKKNPIDFAIWKAQKPGEPAWDSPWGKGRPGWHIECSAMSMKYLGESIDIHGGGIDLVFPHHENEIAQSEAATGKTFSKYWMHNGYINIDNKKMSKSLGNFFTVRDIAKEYDLNVVRMFLMSVHYRSPVNFSEDIMKQSESALQRLQNARKQIVETIETGNDSLARGDFVEEISSYRDRFIEAMDDDINTADAIGVIFDLVRTTNKRFKDGGSSDEANKSLEILDELTGVLNLKLETVEDIPDEIKKLAEERFEARKNKDFQKSDEIRDKLKDLGYSIDDKSGGWKLSKA